MSNRYWVGGTGSWDATTTNWSATSGGAGGASVPTSADDVFFDTLSNATLYTCTLTTAPVCRSVSVAGPAVGNVTMAGSPTWLIYGGLTVAATGVTWTAVAGMFFNATTTGWVITTNGVTMTGSMSFQGSGGAWTLGSALTTSQTITCSVGTFSTANFNITTTSSFNPTGAFTRTLNLGSSAITCLSWNALGATNLTVNAGTSTITVTAAAGQFSGGGLTYYNVYKASNGFAINDANNTFNALTNNNVTASGTFFCQFAGNQTISTLTINGGTDTTRRMSTQTTPTLIGTQVTLTVGTFVTNGNIDFRDINLAGAASPLTVATGGDCGNNTNITLATPKTVYWSLLAGGNWSQATAWATTSGGTPALTNLPLPQDLAIIDDAGLTSGNTITVGQNNPNLGNITVSSRTLPMTLAWVANAPSIYGDLTLSSAVTVTATTGSLTFSGYSKTQTITSAGVTIACQIIIGNPTVTVALSGALTCTNTVTLTSGTLNLANNNLTCNFFASSNTNTRVITFGTSQVYLTGNNGLPLNFDTMTGFTYTGTGVFNLTYSGSVGGRTIVIGNAAGATESNALNVNVTAGTDLCALYGLGLRSVNFTGFAGTFVDTGIRTIYGDFTLSIGMTVLPTGGTTFAATSGTQNITSNNKTIAFPIAKQAAGTLRLVDALTMGSTTSFTLTQGTLNLNNNNLTCGLWGSANTNTRVITFGTGQIYLTGNSGYVLNHTTTNFTYTGSGTFNATYSGATGFRGLLFNSTSEANSLNLNVTAGTDQVQVYGDSFRNINFTGFAGTWVEAGDRTIWGNLTISTGMTVTATSVVRFSATSGTQNITSNGKTLTFPITKYSSGSAGILRLVDALTISSNKSFQLQTGTLDLNGNSLTCGYFEASSSTVTINFSGANIYVSGSGGNVFYIAVVVSYTGVPNFYFTSAATTGGRNIWGNNSAYPLNYFINNGTDTINLQNILPYGAINFTGFGGAFGALTTTITLIGNLTFSSSMTFAASSGSGTLVLNGTGTQSITSNAVTLDAPLTLNGTGSYQLQDNLTIGSTRLLTVTSGTLNLNAKTLTTGTFSSTGSSVRSIAFNGGTITTSGATFTASGTNLTTSGTGTINMTSASSKTFAGGGFSYPTLNQGGAGALVLSGANTVASIQNTVRPATVTFPASTVTTVGTLSLNGTTGSPVTLDSSTSGTRATLSKPTGATGLWNCAVKDILAQGGATFKAPSNYGCTDSGNNSGWSFSFLDTKKDNFMLFFNNSIIAH